jgi:ribosome biogenesis GTPase
MSPTGHSLAAYGLDERVRAEAEAVAAPLDRIGRIVRVERGECDAVTEAGEVRVVSDSLRSQDELAPTTGDWVVVADDPDVGPAIERILPRAATLVRRDPSEQVIEQVLVANVDRVLIVHGLDRPLPPGRLERYLVLTWASGADPHVVLTKLDVAEDLDETRAVVAAVAPSVPIHVVSVETGVGLDDLAGLLAPGTTSVLVGESGAGKSSLINALVGDDRQATAEVRARDAKGRHTTVTRDLVRLPGGGLVVDTPGIRAVGLWGGQDALETVFSDIEDLAGECRFNDCTHGAEPGCAVTEAIAEGHLESRRLDRYRAMAAEIAEQQAREERRRRSPGRRRRR